MRQSITCYTSEELKSRFREMVSERELSESKLVEKLIENEISKRPITTFSDERLLKNKLKKIKKVIITIAYESDDDVVHFLASYANDLISELSEAL